MDIKKESKYDISGIGSALLDMTVKVNEDFLSELKLGHGTMNLVGESESLEIQEKMSSMSAEITAGGSSANTVAGAALLGASTVFMGAVGADLNGKRYINETVAAGVKPELSTAEGMTGLAITLITPDSERTFATHLGAALKFRKENISIEAVAQSKILHLEGYLFEDDNLYSACVEAMEIAANSGTLVSVDLADPALIGRIHDRFSHVLKTYADIVFVNEDEARAFTGRQKGDALNDLAELVSFAVVKLGVEGSLIKTAGRVYSIAPFAAEVVNTNGAGDMYAAGILHGLCRGMEPDMAGKIASFCAAKVVSQSPARLSQRPDLSGL